MTDREIAQDEVHCLQIVRQLLPWREQLATRFGTTHGNGDLQLIDVLIVMLAGFYNPMVRSQRLLEALSSQKWMADMAGLKRIPKSTLSDGLARFDPEQLRPIIEELTRRVPALGRRDADLASVTRQIIAADGSYFQTAVEVAWALAGGNRRDQVRWNLQLDVDSFTPVDGDISGGDDGSEPKALLRRLHSGVIYVVDRNFRSYVLINGILDIGSNFVLRVRADTRLTVQQPLSPNAKDVEAQVQSDQLVRFTGATDASNQDYRPFSDAPPQRTLRLVTILDPNSLKPVMLLTDMLDTPAYVIGAMYRHRWQIELFFKWIKTYANFDHLISHHPNGVKTQFYVAVIATLLLHLYTGRRVSKYALFWLGSVSTGQATADEMLQGLARVEREKELDRARRKRAADRKKIGQ